MLSSSVRFLAPCSRGVCSKYGSTNATRVAWQGYATTPQPPGKKPQQQAQQSKQSQPKKNEGEGVELAKTIFRLASKNNEREVVQNQLNQIKGKFKEDIEFWNLFRTNTVSDNHLKAIKFAPSLHEALTAGKKDKQLQHLATTIKHYNDLVENEPKNLTALVTVPTPMTDAEREKFDKEIRKDYPDVCGNNNITLKESVDPSLLEGYTLQIANLYVDNSAKSRINSFNNAVDAAIAEHFDKQREHVLKMKGWV